MANPKLNRGDYVYCEDCETAVAKNKLAQGDPDFFTGKAPEPSCPFCGGGKLLPLDQQPAG